MKLRAVLFLLVFSAVSVAKSGERKQVQSVDSLEQLLGQQARGTRVNMHMFGNPNVNASVVNENKLKQIFQRLANRTDIPFSVAEDGCYARAHKMAALLEHEGIFSVKIFTRGHLRVNREEDQGGPVFWTYHVAPAVLVKIHKKYEVRVIDPSMFDHPVSVDDWVRAQTADPENPPQVTFRTRFTYDVKAKVDNTFWGKDDLTDTQTKIRMFLRLAADPEALENFRMKLIDYAAGVDSRYPTEPDVFESLFIKIDGIIEEQ